MNQHQSSSKQEILSSLEVLFPGISKLQLPEQNFCMLQLILLQLYVRYSIPYINYPKRVQEFYLKVSDFYWQSQMNLRGNKQKLKDKAVNIQTDEQVVNIQTDEQVVNIQSIEQVVNIQTDEQAVNNSIEINNLQLANEQKKTGFENSNVQLKELDAKKQQDCIDLQKKKKVIYAIKNYTYQEIMSKLDYVKSQSYQNNQTSIHLKVNEVNSWEPVDIVASEPNTKSQTFIQNFKMQTQKKFKEEKNQLQSPKIILGKNQSVQTRQIKHQLKLKAKQSYAQTKQKQQLLMNQLEKHQIQLTFLLNIITFQYFQEFYYKIKTLILLNQDCICILCEKIIFKVKQEHNFIQIYLMLVKKLSKINKSEFVTIQEQSKFNSFHLTFVELFQASFYKLLMVQNDLNENLYKKQLKGYFTFMGKLIQSKIISKQIFKICFWDLLFQYIYNNQFKLQTETSNQCLLEGIFILAQNMGNKYFQLTKINLKQNDKSKIQINSIIFDQIKTNVENIDFKSKLLAQITPSSYLQILKLINQQIKSQRRKIQFLIRNLEERTQSQKKYNLLSEYPFFSQSSKLQKGKQQSYADIPPILVDQNVEKIIEQIMEYSLQMKQQQVVEKIGDLNIILAQKEQNLFISSFLLQFADGSKKVVLKRSEIFVKLMQKYIFIQKKLDKEFSGIFCNLMLISCDFPYLVCQLGKIISKAQQLNDEFLEILQQSLNLNDQDLNQFWQQIYKQVQHKTED